MLVGVYVVRHCVVLESSVKLKFLFLRKGSSGKSCAQIIYVKETRYIQTYINFFIFLSRLDRKKNAKSPLDKAHQHPLFHEQSTPRAYIQWLVAAVGQAAAVHQRSGSFDLSIPKTSTCSWNLDARPCCGHRWIAGRTKGPVIRRSNSSSSQSAASSYHVKIKFRHHSACLRVYLAAKSKKKFWQC